MDSFLEDLAAEDKRERELRARYLEILNERMKEVEARFMRDLKEKQGTLEVVNDITNRLCSANNARENVVLFCISFCFYFRGSKRQEYGPQKDRDRRYHFSFCHTFGHYQRLFRTVHSNFEP